MTKNDCFYLGYISRRVGNKGELGFVLDVDIAARYQKLNSVFIEINNSLVPFFIKKIKIYNKNATVSIEDVESIERAEELVGTQLYLPLNLLPELKGKTFYFHEVIGFKVIDEILGDIGVVSKVLEFPQQAILEIIKGKDEILIPAKEDFIVAVNRETREIHVNPPEGLIDVYLKKNNTSEEEKEDE